MNTSGRWCFRPYRFDALPDIFDRPRIGEQNVLNPRTNRSNRQVRPRLLLDFHHRRHVVKQIEDLAVGIELPKVACLGLAYKADIDDLRESPAVEIVRQLAATGMREILVVEPYVNSLPDSLADLDRTRLCDLDTALSLADIVVLLTDHRVFREFDRKVLTRKRILDTRGAWR